MKHKRALLIGINYTGTSHQLSGCINDAKNVGALLTAKGYVCTYLLDEEGQTSPTRTNIMAAIRAFAAQTEPDDSLFFHYSGHGTSTHDSSGDELDGRDEALCPLSGRSITDDELRAALIDPLPAGSTLFMLLDCCHSGTGADLRYNYEDLSECTVRPMPVHFKLSEWKRTVHFRENAKCAESRAAVICISGCLDAQTSADTVFDEKACGAMTAAFLRAITHHQDGNLVHLYQYMACMLRCYRYSQVPQLSFGRGETDAAYAAGTAHLTL